MTIVHGESLVLAPHGKVLTKKETWFFGQRFQGDITYTDDRKPYFARLTGTSAEGERAEVALASPAILSTTGLFFLAGASPERLFGLNCVVLSDAGGKVHFANYGGTAPNFTVKRVTIPVDRNFTFDAKTLAPKKEDMFQYRQADWDSKVWLPCPFERWEVQKTTTYKGLILPKRIFNVVLRPNRGYTVARKTTFTLTGIKETAKHLEIPIPIGLRVEDYRLDAVDRMFGEFPNGARPVTYTWTGHLPSLDELKAM